MKRHLTTLCAALALALTVPLAANAATASELKLDWKMTAAAAPTVATATKAQTSGLFAWLPAFSWSNWFGLSTAAPYTVIYMR